MNEKVKKLKEFFLDKVSELGYDIEVRNYSGRFMFGRETFGLVGGQNELDCFLVDCCDGKMKKDVSNFIKNKRIDNMGFDTIYYVVNSYQER